MSGVAKFKNNVKISEHHGAGEWLAERVLLTALLPLGVWVASNGFTLAGVFFIVRLALGSAPLPAGFGA